MITMWSSLCPLVISSLRQDAAAATDLTDSDANPTTGRTITTTLISGENDLTWDAGLAPLATIGDRVWIDTNHNGIQNAGEFGIAGVRVNLLDAAGKKLKSTVTDAVGNYLFENLIPADYSIQVVKPSGYEFTLIDVGLDDAVDSDVDLNTARTIPTTLDYGETDLTWDAGVVLIPVPLSAVTPTPAISDTAQSATCQRGCVDWQLYHTNQTGDWEIFRLDKQLDGKTISTNLSQGKGADDMAPTRSPNAQWIVFSSNRDGNWELYLAPSDGDASRIRLTYNTVARDTDPVWGPNNYVVYETTRDGNWELYLLDMTTGKEHRLTNNPASDINAYWSTDGKKLIFQSDRSGLWQIYEFELATGAIKQLSDGTTNDVDPQYSNDSSRISFRSYRNGAKSTLYIMNANGSGLKRISDVKGDATNQSWSSDDSLIAYQSDLDSDLDIYVYQVGTGITRKLTDNTIPDYAPTWLCSSTIVLFTSDIDGNPNIFDANAVSITAPAIDVAKDAERLTTNPADDIYPENSPVEENASREGHLPGINLGDQTDFLIPDVSVTKIDPSLETGKVWEPLDSCAINPSEPEDSSKGR